MKPELGAEQYRQGHVPGALFAHLDHDLSAAKTGSNGRHPLPDPDAFIAWLGQAGLRRDDPVVCYDAGNGSIAARLWWMLRWVGHDAVAVLDGGLPAWTALDLPLEADVPASAPGNLQQRPPLVRTVAAGDILSQPQLKVLDARAPDRFRGENETLDPVGGHIPGAANRFFKDNLLPDGRFKPAAQLRAELGALVAEPASAVMQCGSGVTACHNLLALEVAGLPGAALYPGSWSEWCADPSRPVATGA
jgi:thiosulfate/3-mercaptopyruvate sulfurtransferase